MAKNCLQCDEVLFGRSDKKFCDDHCRSLYHHNYRKENFQRVKEVNSILARNRRLLKHFAKHCADVLTIDVETLEAKGFNPTFFTHQRKKENGDVVYMCYDTGYVKEDADWVRIIPERSSSF